MTVGELLDLLENVDRGQEVKLATQPNWPIATHLAGVYDGADAGIAECEEHHRTKCEECEFDGESEYKPILWLVEGSQDDNPYSVPEECWTDAKRR